MGVLPNAPIYDFGKLGMGGEGQQWFVRLVALIRNVIAGSGVALTNGNRAVVSTATGGLTESATTDTEIGYVHGVTSAIQTQLNAKVAKTAIAALTDSTGGTADGTLSDVGAAFSQATLNNNFAELAAKIEAIRAAMQP